MSGHEWTDGVVHTADGPLHYRTIGRGSPLVALHGIQGTAGVWADVGSRLATRYTVVAPNLRGRRPSAVPSERQHYSMRCFADDVRAVVETVGEPVALVGWSMGVLVTLEYLRQGWPMPRALVLTGGTAHLADTRWFEGRSDEEVGAEARERASRLGLTEAADPYAVAASWWHASRADYRPTLSSLQVPCLLLHGTDDDQCPLDHARTLAARLPDAELRTWPGGGHNLMAADPAGFAAAVDGFVADR